MYDALMVIAHPDDDALFGGVFQKATKWLKWGIVCCCGQSAVRKKELLEWQQSLGVYSDDIYFLDFYADPNDWLQLQDKGIEQCSIDYKQVARKLGGLNIEAKLCLTHNEVGERSVIPQGHPHHKCIHKAVMESHMADKIYVFGWGLENYYHNTKGYNLVIEVNSFVEEAKSIYKSQARSIGNVHNILDCCRRGIYRCSRS